MAYNKKTVARNGQGDGSQFTTVELPIDLHAQAKVAGFLRRLTLRQVIISALELWLEVNGETHAEK